MQMKPLFGARQLCARCQPEPAPALALLTAFPRLLARRHRLPLAQGCLWQQWSRDEGLRPGNPPALLPGAVAPASTTRVFPIQRLLSTPALPQAETPLMLSGMMLIRNVGLCIY